MLERIIMALFEDIDQQYILQSIEIFPYIRLRL